MQNAGQTCISVERVYVEEPVYDEFVAKVTDKVRALRQGEPRRPGRGRRRRDDLPAADRHRRATTCSDAVDKGARVLAGGKRAEGTGRFYEPTVLVDVDHTMKCMTEETFGPTLPIMKVARRRRGGAPRQRLALRPRGVGVDQGHRAAARTIARRVEAGRGVRQRRADQLRRARAADGRLEGVRARLAPRRRRHPQVLRPAVAPASRASRPRRTSTCSRTASSSRA